jgi:uncharacterized membrane protein
VTERALRLAIAGLALAGAGIAAYLTFVRYTGGAPACATGGCETVQDSEYAVVLGVPVAVLGLAVYLLVAGSTLRSGEAAAAAGAALALAGAAIGAYLLYAQVALIDAICQWCVASDAVMALLLGVTLLRLRAVVRAAPLSGGSPG